MRVAHMENDKQIQRFSRKLEGIRSFGRNRQGREKSIKALS